MVMVVARMVAFSPDFVLGAAKIENFPNLSASIENRCLQFPLARSNFSARKGRLQLSAARSNLSTFLQEARFNLFKDSQTASAPPPPVEGLIGLSVADLRGITVAVDSLYCGDSVKVTSVPSGEFPLPMWTTIGQNLIAYGVGDQANLQFYFDLLTTKFSHLDLVDFMDILTFNQFGLFDFEWSHCGGFTIHVRDRTRVENLLIIELDQNFYFSQFVSKETSASIGTGGPSAQKVLNNFINMISCNEFSTNEKLREHIVSKAIVEAMVNNEYYNKFLKANTCFKGYAEVLWGSPTECWKVVSRTSMDQLLNMYDSQELRDKNSYTLPFDIIARCPHGVPSSDAALVKELEKKHMYRPSTSRTPTYKITAVDTGPYDAM